MAVCLMRRLRRAERDRQGLAQGLPDGESIGDTGLGRSQGSLSQPVGWLAQPGGARLQGEGRELGAAVINSVNGRSTQTPSTLTSY